MIGETLVAANWKWILGLVARRAGRCLWPRLALRLKAAREIVAQVLDKIAGLDSRPLRFEEFSPLGGDAEAFVRWVGSCDSYRVLTLAGDVGEERTKWPEHLASYKGMPFRTEFRAGKGLDRYCTLTFPDGARVTCNTARKGKALAPVRLESADPHRANQMRIAIDRSRIAMAVGKTFDHYPYQINAATGETREILQPYRTSIEGGELKTRRSEIWDWRAALASELDGSEEEVAAAEAAMYQQLKGAREGFSRATNA